MKWTRTRVKKTNMITFPNPRNKNDKNAIDCPKRGKAGGTEGTKAEDLKDCDDETKKYERHFHRDHQTREHDPAVLENIVINVIYKIRWCDKKRHVTAQSARYRRFTMCSRHHLKHKCFTHFNLLIRSGSEEVARLQTTTPHTDCLNKKAGSGRSTCASPRLTSC